MNYKIALVNVFWSEGEQNTRYFDNITLQNNYFDSLASGKTSPLVNYNMGNNIETTIVFRDTTERPIDEVVKSNYAIVYTMDGDNIVNRRYFFAYPRQDSGRQMIVNLSLDDVQTNFIRNADSFKDATIRRAHLDRFNYIPGSIHGFELKIGTEGPFNESENIGDMPKRLIKKASFDLLLEPDDGITGRTGIIDPWFKDNIIGWEYVYLTPDDLENNTSYVYKGFDPSDGTTSRDLELTPLKTNTFEGESLPFGETLLGNFNRSNMIQGALICVCAPIYKKDSYLGRDNVIKFKGRSDTTGIAITTYGISQFLELNGRNSRVYARKFSIRPPFAVEGYSGMVDIDYTLNSLEFKGNRTTKHIDFGYLLAVCSGTKSDGWGDTRLQGCIVVLQDPSIKRPYQSESLDTEILTRFSSSDIVNGARNDTKLNPKLLSNKFLELNLTNFSQSFTYEMLKLSHDRGYFYNHIAIIYNEALTPDITKGYARLKAPNGLYVEDTNINLTGLVISNDYSLMVANDQLSQMLANNKNFYLQQAINIGKDVVSTTIKGGEKGGGEGAAVGAATGAINAGLSVLDTTLTLDNMRNAPSQVRNANGNVYFASQIQPFKLSLEIYDALEQDKQKFNDFCYYFGYAYNRKANITSFTRTRRFFNYIEADLNALPISISNIEKDRIKARFNRGIRFWHTDDINGNDVQTKQNAERDVYSDYINSLREVNNNE